MQKLDGRLDMIVCDIEMPGIKVVMMSGAFRG